MHPLNEHEALETEKRGESSERCMSSYLFLISKEPLTINQEITKDAREQEKKFANSQ